MVTTMVLEGWSNKLDPHHSTLQGEARCAALRRAALRCSPLRPHQRPCAPVRRCLAVPHVWSCQDDCNLTVTTRTPSFAAEVKRMIAASKGGLLGQLTEVMLRGELVSTYFCRVVFLWLFVVTCQ